MSLLATHRESTGVIEFETQSPQSWAMAVSQPEGSGSYGFSLTHEPRDTCYAIIRHNIRTYRSAGVVEVVKGKQHAESTLQVLETCQDSSDHYEGWRYFIEKSDLQAGSDPAEATQHRQEELERRESKALREKNDF